MAVSGVPSRKQLREEGEDSEEKVCIFIYEFEC